MKYMLDTNIIVYIINNKPEKVFKRFREHEPGDLCISAITMAELEYGIANSTRPEQNRMALMFFLSGIQIMPFDEAAAGEYGSIRAELRKKGQPIGANDLLIAAHAKAMGLTLVTNNVKEFRKVREIKVENWAL